MLRALLLALAALSTVPAQAGQLSVAQINAYLNKMRSATAQFVQANPDQTLAQGVLYLKKPGQIRYEYTVPDDSLVISDGRQIGIFDKRSNAGAQRYALKETPLDLLLRDNLNLAATGAVRGLWSDGVQTRIVAGDPANPKAGTLAMVFTDNPIELRQWIVTDNRGRKTTVILSDLKVTNAIPSRLFNIRINEEILGVGTDD